MQKERERKERELLVCCEVGHSDLCRVASLFSPRAAPL